MTSSTVIYSELLLNIQQLTVFISLSSSSDKDTTIELAEDGDKLVVTHERQRCSIDLPVKILDSSSLKLPDQPTKDFSIRLPAPKGSGTTRHAHEKKTFIVPWSAQALEGATGLLCRYCSHCLIHVGQAHEWKDLPAENWAEMMDFWHCHKPDINDEKSTTTHNTKGYAATNKLTAQSGVGFVNVNSVLLSPESCSGVKPYATATRRTLGFLSQADSDGLLDAGNIGFVDERAEGWTIYAWNISVPIVDLGTPRSWPRELIISAQLLGMVDHQATRKFMIRADDGEEGEQGAILLWVFTPDMYYSSSSSLNAGPLRAMKVFYQEVVYASDMRKEQSRLYDELNLPCNALRELRRIMKLSNSRLPTSLRLFQDWNVALLERFSFYEEPT
ncbi:MAG: hypothetical protein M1816_003278 [Peltula sp. TS41687]|nr:MAG: hypothetical protein M1816_003278 [Peltula sp. TS41687]